jgi:outer membrane lipoprotein-sorting protein
MTSTHLWDRAAALPVPADGRRLPELVALPTGLPDVAELFTFMRDAELRFATLLMRISDQSQTARGEEATNIEVAIRHPGRAKVTTSQAAQAIGGDYEVWVSDGVIVRTYSGTHKLGTQRPIRNRPRGLDDPDLPGPSKVYEPVTLLPAETLPDTFVHPGGLCQNVLSTGRCTITGTTVAIGREAITLECAHPRSTELATDRPDFRLRLTVDRATGVIVRLVEAIGDDVRRDAQVLALDPDAALPPSALEFSFPSGTTMLY